MLDCEGSLNSVELIRSLSEMEPSGVSVEVTESCTNKDHCQSPPMAHERASSTLLKVVTFASRSFSTFFAIFSGLRPT